MTLKMDDIKVQVSRELSPGTGLVTQLRCAEKIRHRNEKSLEIPNPVLRVAKLWQKDSINY